MGVTTINWYYGNLVINYCPEHGVPTDMTSKVTTDMTSDECEDQSLTQSRSDCKYIMNMMITHSLKLSP